MKKSDFNNIIRDYCHQNLSPSVSQQDLITKIYDEINEVLGVNNCIQIGSYARFTAINPVHDLDILYILGEWNSEEHDPTYVLRELFSLITKNYNNPTEYAFTVSLQKHSVNLAFGDEFSVDIVPSYIYGKNDFGQDMYKIPEILKEKHHVERKNMQWDFLNEKQWIDSDPRGYSKLATIVGENPDFRKTVKFIKKWKHNLREEDSLLKLRSFHVEQVIVQYFLECPEAEIFDMIFRFFSELPQILENPNEIADRANPNLFIDDYLVQFTPDQKEKIVEARDAFLIKLENLESNEDISDLLVISFRKRMSDTEKYLFDDHIKVLTEEEIKIVGWIQKDGKDFRPLAEHGLIDKKFDIRFIVSEGLSGANYKWKVKNDDKSAQPRGEITDNHTLKDPERTAFPGSHYVECFAVKAEKCVAKAKQKVIIRS